MSAAAPSDPPRRHSSFWRLPSLQVILSRRAPAPGPVQTPQLSSSGTTPCGRCALTAPPGVHIGSSREFSAPPLWSPSPPTARIGARRLRSSRSGHRGLLNLHRTHRARGSLCVSTMPPHRFSVGRLPSSRRAVASPVPATTRSELPNACCLASKLKCLCMYR